MKVITLKTLPIERQYKNNGQHAEQVARYTLTGKIMKADNKEHRIATDVLNIQIKSARATICKGTDLIKYVREDKATYFGYVNKDFSKMYIMNKLEYIAFCFKFMIKDTESKTKETKLRLSKAIETIERYLAIKAR